MNKSERGRLAVSGGEVEWFHITGQDKHSPTLILLHEGLGCIDLWKQFPELLANKTGHSVFAYSRLGYGQSDPVELPRPLSYMHDEARIQLPEILEGFGIERCILIGHSDGASIAAIHAGSSCMPGVKGLVLIAPHVFVEEISVNSIEAARTAYEKTDLRARLAIFHKNVDCAFRGWNDAWLDPGFRDWNLESYLPAIEIPVLLVQGEDDEYGTLEQVNRIERAVSGPVIKEIFPGCRHSPHREKPQLLLDTIKRFILQIDV